MVDHGLTKGVILCPTKKTIDAAGVASLFFSKVFKRFGLYDKIISDRGPQFASTFAKELGKLLGYELALSTAYHPQTDGETKCVNQEGKPIFGSSAAPTLLLGLNTSPSLNSPTITAPTL